jgi:hypothetical protein
MPPVVDGHITLEFEGGTGRIRTPYLAGLIWTADCKYVRKIYMRRQWHNDKLVVPNAIPESDFVDILISIQPSGKPHPAVKPLESWQFDPVLPHQKYPIEFYPKTGWSAPDNPSSGGIRRPTWGIRGTMDPETWRPFLTGCDILPRDPQKPDSVVDGDFPSSNANAKCSGSIRIAKGRSDVYARVDVPAKGVPNINRIYRAVSELIVPLIQE